MKIVQILSVSVLAYASLQHGDDCVSSNDGGRIGYHSPGQSDQYLPNCNNALKRELWRVFKKEDGTAYMIPRPDGIAKKIQICADFPPLKDVKIKQKAQEYGLCGENISNPAIVNSMDPTDALAFSTIFHRHLRFVANGNIIEPWVPDEDILLACKHLESENDIKTSKSFCEKVAGRYDPTIVSVDTMFILPTNEAVNELVPALNDVYGIKDPGDSCKFSVWGATFQYPVAKCMAPPEGCTYSREYFINDVGDCIQPQCYAVDTNGNQCEFGKDGHTVQSEIDGLTSRSEGVRNILSYLLIMPVYTIGVIISLLI